MVKVKIEKETEIEITKDDWKDYERVRASGITNMFDLRKVEALSGLNRDKTMAIIENYEELEKEFEKNEVK